MELLAGAGLILGGVRPWLELLAGLEFEVSGAARWLIPGCAAVLVLLTASVSTAANINIYLQDEANVLGAVARFGSQVCRTVSVTFAHMQTGPSARLPISRRKTRTGAGVKMR